MPSFVFSHFVQIRVPVAPPAPLMPNRCASTHATQANQCPGATHLSNTSFSFAALTPKPSAEYSPWQSKQRHVCDFSWHRCFFSVRSVVSRSYSVTASFLVQVVGALDTSLARRSVIKHWGPGGEPCRKSCTQKALSSRSVSALFTRDRAT